ncbi:MAG: hypothetical protein DRN20_04945 [Thermoplasmata archaeon]|nr:MAG: hypothetical protein DRN20_04945 [Thermoplasmata archaeon]
MPKKQAIIEDVRGAISELVYRITREEIGETEADISNLVDNLTERRGLSFALVEVLRIHLPKQHELYKKAVSIASRLKRACESLSDLDNELDELHKKWREFDNEFDKEK